jgi:hypothetical protein
MHFTRRINEVFTGSPDGNYAHCTLRTVFDFPAHEWSETTMAEKVEILRTLANCPERLFHLIMQYMEYYRQLRPDTADPMTILWSLADIMEFALQNEPPADE